MSDFFTLRDVTSVNKTVGGILVETRRPDRTLPFFGKRMLSLASKDESVGKLKHKLAFWKEVCLCISPEKKLACYPLNGGVPIAH